MRINFGNKTGMDASAPSSTITIPLRYASESVSTVAWIHPPAGGVLEPRRHGLSRAVVDRQHTALLHVRVGQRPCRASRAQSGLQFSTRRAKMPAPQTILPEGCRLMTRETETVPSMEGE